MVSGNSQKGATIRVAPHDDGEVMMRNGIRAIVACALVLAMGLCMAGCEDSLYAKALNNMNNTAAENAS